MRISFDMDDTLVPRGRDSAEAVLLNGDRLRKGALPLLRELAQEHELWIYTTSYRNPWYLRFSFWLKGVRIRKVVNEAEHQRMIRKYGFDVQPSKYPKHYGIDLHVDDSRGVLEEGRQFGFRVIQIDLDDDGWVDKVRTAIHLA